MNETEIEAMRQQIASMQRRLDNAKAFYDLVKEMRKQQRMFFATHFDCYKKASIALERQVDDEIDRVENKLKPIQQTLAL